MNSFEVKQVDNGRDYGVDRDTPNGRGLNHDRQVLTPHQNGSDQHV